MLKEKEIKIQWRKDEKNLRFSCMFRRNSYERKQWVEMSSHPVCNIRAEWFVKIILAPNLHEIF